MKFKEVVFVYEVDPHLVPFLEDTLSDLDFPGYFVRYRVHRGGRLEVVLSSASPKAVQYVQRLVDRAVRDARTLYKHAQRIARLLSLYGESLDLGLDLEVVQ